LKGFRVILVQRKNLLGKRDVEGIETKKKGQERDDAQRERFRGEEVTRITSKETAEGDVETLTRGGKLQNVKEDVIQPAPAKENRQ